MSFNIFISSSIHGLYDAVRIRLVQRQYLQGIVKLLPLDPSNTETYKTSQIVLGDPDAIAPLVPNMENLQWVQSTFAGVEPILRRSDRRDYKLTRCGGKMGTAMAQYVFGWITAIERKFFLAKTLQQEKKWDHESCMYRPFKSVTVGILGLGDIGSQIAKVLRSMGCSVIGFKRHPVNNELSNVLVSNNLSDILSQADYIVNVLPSTPHTTHLLSGDILQVCKQKAPVFINVGRGNVIDESSLIGALEKRWLSTAILDVFEAEPLPLSSNLWDHPCVYITPHVSALSMADDVADVFVENLERFVNSDVLFHEVNWNKGY